MWLAARLAAAGYEVWSDVTKLIGGERFWRDVEAAIRGRCAKFIAVVSPAITKKRGFLKELSLADTVEGLGTLGDFIIPVRIASLPFADLPIELQGKNVIDAIGAWDQGLARLLKKLQGDNVPRRDDGAAAAVTQWAKDHFAFESRLRFENERVLSNWLSIPAPPPTLHVGRFTLTSDDVHALQEQFPCVQRHSRVLSFAPTMAFDLSGRYGLRAASEVATETFLAVGAGELFGLSYQDRANILTDLVHQAWILSARARGLACFHLANGRDCWYWSAARTDVSRVRFTDALGVSGQRALRGQSRALGAHWHLALEARPSIGRVNRFTLTPHVLFTTDGEALVGDSARMHRLRRRFCKNWWQGRWREVSRLLAPKLERVSRLIWSKVANISANIAESVWSEFCGEITPKLGGHSEQALSSGCR